MPNLINRLAQNVPGAFYVDDSCTDCDLCRSIAPEFFRRDDEQGFSIVYRQPVTTDETDMAQEATDSCPSSSIGCDGSPPAL